MLSMTTMLKQTMSIIVLLQTVFLTMDCLAQNNGRSSLYLTNYTISKETSSIGFLKVSGGEIKSVTVDGKHADAFEITKDHELLVRADKLKSPGQWFEITVNAKTSAGPISRTFRIVKNEFIHNKVIAHRGAWKNTGVPENSLAALHHAVGLGCEGSEFDVHMSSDSLPVINHDPTIQGVSIAKTSSHELLALKLANGETLPTLENYLQAGMQQTKTKLILEIKPSELGRESSLALTRKVVSLVEKLQAQAWVDYISFDYDVCKEVMTLAPYANVAYLRGDKTPTELAADKFFGLDYNVGVLQKNPEWINEAKSKKLTINVWTVNDRSIMDELLQKGVDFITTNEPELLLSIVNGMPGKTSSEKNK